MNNILAPVLHPYVLRPLWPTAAVLLPFAAPCSAISTLIMPRFIQGHLPPTDSTVPPVRVLLLFAVFAVLLLPAAALA